MEILLEIIWNVVLFSLEILMQIFPEFFAEMGLRSLVEPLKDRKEINPIMAGIGYMLYGAVIGVISLMLFPQPFVPGAVLQKVNLLVTPVACGLIMAANGRYRTRAGKEIIRLDTFVYGFLFAFSMAFVRFGFHHYGVFK